MKTSSELKAFLKTKGLTAKFNNKPFGKYQKMYMLYRGIGKKDHKEFEKYAVLFKEEFDRYPEKFLQSIKLKSVTFVTGLKNNGSPMKAHAVSASPDVGTSSLILDITYIDDEEYCRRCIHHELFHLVEWNIHGTYQYEDPAWMKLNSKKFKYGLGGWTAYKDKVSYTEHPKKGFASNYAMTAIEEDRAETVSYILTDSARKKLKVWIKKDKALGQKVRLIKKFYSELGY